MAAELGGALLGKLVSDLSDVIKLAIKRAWYFKSKLKKMEETINSIMPIFNDMEKLNKELDRRKEETESFIILIKQAEDLVRKCENIKWNIWKRSSHASKLDDMNISLQNYVQFDLQLQNFRNGAEKLVVVKGLKERLENKCSNGRSSGVPSEKCVVIGFDDQVRDLKDMVLKDSPDGDCSVVVVSAAGGCGKTTLVTMLCHDPEIQGRYGEHIYYVTVSRTYDLKVVIKKLLGKLDDVTNDDDAIQQWGSFLVANKSEKLLVLDDVWSDSIIMRLKFKSPGYKILVTSRTAFTQFNNYKLQKLNHQHATKLFTRSAFSEHNNIPDDLVDKLVKCCKKHPMTLSVIGGLLKGTRVANWEVMLKKLSVKNNAFSNFDKSIQDCLEKSLYFFEEEPEMKQCYMDLGLFPEDQKIAATALMDMWAHLYHHDEEGLATVDNLTKLSSTHFATLLPKRKHLSVIANHCEEEFVMQHDIMRELAIHLSNQESKELRERLIINADGQDVSQLHQIVNARVLSITTDESFYSTWNEFKPLKWKFLY